MLIAQLTDPHIGASSLGKPHGLAAEVTLQRAIADLLASHQLPDMVVLSGDLVETGSPAEYAVLRELIAPLTMPTYLMAGNHDDRHALVAAFPGHPYLASSPPFIQYGVDAGDWRLLFLDSLEPGHATGHLCQRRLAWLAGELERAADRPVVVFVHHPPLETGAAHIDRSRLVDADGFANTLGRHPRVERVLCGHVHRGMHARWANTFVTTCPSVYYEFLIDFRDDSRFTASSEMPGYQLHHIHDDRLLTYTLSLA